MPASRLLVVIDTKVWISGLLTRTGAPALLTRQVVGSGQPVLSPQSFAELEERLNTAAASALSSLIQTNPPCR